jgi:hypothetical protein
MKGPSGPTDRRPLRRALVAAGVALIVLAAGDGKAVAAEPAPAQLEEARARFARGKQLFDEKDYAGALVEFQRAYAVVPSAVTELNIAYVYVQLHRPVDAVDALEIALRATDLPAAHAQAARTALADQRARIGYVAVTTNWPAGLELDGVEVARTPLAAPVRVGEGLHTLAAIAPGCAPVRKEIRVAGGATETVTFQLTLAPVSASLTVAANIVDADVVVDGRPAGRTPLSASLTVSPGSHQVVLRRDGYVEASRSIAVEAGASGAVSAELDEDRAAPASIRGMLVLATSEPAVTLTIDGKLRGTYRGEPLQLPRGRHHIRADREGFVAAEADVEVPAGGEAQAHIALEPTAETYVVYTRSARRQRAWGWSAAAAGLAIGALSGVLAWHYGRAVHDAQTTIDTDNEKYQLGTAGCDVLNGFTPGSDTCKAIQDADYTRLNAAENRRRLAWGGVALGGVAAGIGGYLLFTGDDPHKYDRPRAAAAGIETAPLVWLDGHGGGVVLSARF